LNAAAVVINIVAIGSGGSIIAITIAVTAAVAVAVVIAVDVSTIAVVAVIIDVASSTLLHHCCPCHVPWRPIRGA
jgi:hypothetical protein